MAVSLLEMEGSWVGVEGKAILSNPFDKSWDTIKIKLPFIQEAVSA